MGNGGQSLELFLGQPGVGNSKEILINSGFPAEVTKTEDSIGKGRNLGQHRKVSEDQQGENKSTCQYAGDIKV